MCWGHHPKRSARLHCCGRGTTICCRTASWICLWQAKRHAEQRMGKRLEARAHATWAESPTIDYWNTGQESLPQYQYEYTSNFVWSCTVHQAAAACYDYFKWGDFLTGNGNDHAEGGWLDRDYYALALACSTGILNEVPNSYAAHWGMPGEIHMRRASLVSAYGASGHPYWTAVQDAQHRDVDVLMLYPLDLVAVDERFGSWMTQYGYANYITRAKLLERGTVRDGAIDLAGRRFTTLVALFEPFPTAELLQLMRQLVEQGGRVVWSGPPPVVQFDGRDAREAWTSLFGVDYTPQRRRRTPGARPNRHVSRATWRCGATDDPHRLPRGPDLSRDAASRDGNGRHRTATRRGHLSYVSRKRHGDLPRLPTPGRSIPQPRLRNAQLVRRPAVAGRLSADRSIRRDQ